jgi:hemerythrin-like domain-containing protein
MDAIKLLEEQHELVETLFDQACAAKTANARADLFAQIGDALAIHSALEEKLFYPAVVSQKTNAFLFEAVEEHLAAKRLIADLLGLSPSDEHYRAKIVVLREEIRHHIREERKELFPKARRLLDKEQLEQLGSEMQAMATNLETSRNPRLKVPEEIAQAAPLPIDW